jgi:hypothetical protein
MVIEIEKNASPEAIRQALEQMKKQNKPQKGYPDLEKFSGIFKERDYVSIQKQMRDEWG